jgi:hypothetical protein
MDRAQNVHFSRMATPTGQVPGQNRMTAYSKQVGPAYRAERQLAWRNTLELAVDAGAIPPCELFAGYFRSSSIGGSIQNLPERLKNVICGETRRPRDDIASRLL